MRPRLSRVQICLDAFVLSGDVRDPFCCKGAKDGRDSHQEVSVLCARARVSKSKRTDSEPSLAAIQHFTFTTKHDVRARAAIFILC